MASCINNQAFPAVPNISGNFLIQRAGRQLHSPTCYSWFHCITSIIKKKNLGLCYFTETNKTVNPFMGQILKGVWKVFRDG